MLQQTNLQGMTTTALEHLRLQVCLDFFAPDTTDADRDVLGKFDDAIKCCIPHSFVLSSLFDVEAMSLEIPEHVLESDPSLEWVTCPCCDGEKWLETTGNGWTKALFADERYRYVYSDLGSSYKVCGRCRSSGEVLDLATLDIEIKMVAENPRSTPVRREIFENTLIPLLPKLTQPLEPMLAMAA